MIITSGVGMRMNRHTELEVGTREEAKGQKFRGIPRIQRSVQDLLE